MPRASTSEASRILKFFQTAALETAVLVFGLVGDVMRERRAVPPAAPKQRRARRVKVTAMTAAPAAAPPVNEAVGLVEQPTARKRRARKPAEAAQPELPPADGGEGAEPAPGEYGSDEQ